MLKLKGKYNDAVVYTDNIDEKSIGQILNLLNNENFKDSKIRIMPDVHAGAGCVVGLSMTITDKVVPNLVGVDVGCGVLTVRINARNIDFEKLDNVIRTHIPSGFDVRETPHENNKLVSHLYKSTKAPFNEERARLSLGTLGGGKKDCHLSWKHVKINALNSGEPLDSRAIVSQAYIT